MPSEHANRSEANIQSYLPPGSNWAGTSPRMNNTPPWNYSPCRSWPRWAPAASSAHRCQSSRAADTWATAQSPAARSASAVGRPRRRSPCGWERRRGWRIGSAVVWPVRRAHSGRRSARSSTSTWGACARKSSPPGWSSAPGSTEARRTGTRFRQRVTRRT